jgi:hypothetical protein
MKKISLAIVVLSGFDLCGMEVTTTDGQEKSTAQNLTPISAQEGEEVAQNSVRPDQFSESVDPQSPIYETREVPYQVWVQSGYETSQNGLAGLFGGSRWVDTSHLETRYRTEKVVVGYEPLTTAEAII